MSDVTFAHTTPAFDPADGADTVGVDGIVPEDRLPGDTSGMCVCIYMSVSVCGCGYIYVCVCMDGCV